MITGIRYKIFKDGAVCPGGLLHTFESGTSTPKAVFSDATLSTPLSNPVVMDQEGEAVLFLGEGAYRFLEQDADGVQIKAPVDGITANQSSATASSGLATNVNVRMSTTGSSATITISADRLALMNAAGDVLVAEDVVTSINCASVGAGGLDTGSLAADTFYSIYAIANEVDGVLSSISACISSSEFAPTVTGYDYSVRLGSVRTDSSGNKYPLAGTWEGARFSYKVVAGSNVAALPIVATGASGNVATPTYTATPWAAFAPSTASILHFVLRTSNHTAMVAPNNSYGAASSTTNPPPFVASNAGINAVPADIVPESENVYYAADGSSARLLCLGWTDGLSYTSGELAGQSTLRADLAADSGADLVGFSHAETYTAGTVGDRLKKVVYVTDAPYLAEADTGTDQTTQIQAAYTAVRLAGGGVVNFPLGGGVFDITQSILVGSNTITNLNGCTVRAKQTGFVGTNAGLNCFLFRNYNYSAASLTDESIQFNGPGTLDYGTVTISGGGAHAIAMRYVDNVTVRDVFATSGENVTAFLACKDTLVANSEGYNQTNCYFDHWDGAGYAKVIGSVGRNDGGTYIAQGIQFTGTGSAGENRSSVDCVVAFCKLDGVRGASGQSSALISNANDADSSTYRFRSVLNTVSDSDQGLVFAGAGGQHVSLCDTFVEVDQLPIFLQTENSDSPASCQVINPVLIDCNHTSGNIALISVAGTGHKITNVNVINAGAAPYIRLAWLTSAATSCLVEVTGCPSGSGVRVLDNGTGSIVVDDMRAPTATSSTGYAVTASDKIVIFSAGSTATMPSAASYAGRELTFVTQSATAVISAASNIVPLAGGAAGTAILAATAGKWADMVSNGTNWLIVRAN